MSKKDDAGVSSVLAIILLVAVTVALVALAANFVFNIGQSSAGNIGDVSVTLGQNGDEVKATMLKDGTVDTVRIEGPNQSSTNVNSVGESVSLQDGNGLYTAIAVTERGSEQVVSTTDTNTGASIPDADAGGGQVVNGVVEVNPPIPGATVEAVDNTGAVVDSTTTDSNGEYSLTVSDTANTTINVDVNGFTFEERELYAGTKIPADAPDTSVNFDETERANTTVNSSDVSVIYDGDGTSDDPHEISNLRELKAMSTFNSRDYELVTNIDATETQNFNSGRGFDPITGFSGSFDGQNHKVDGLFIDRPAATNVGLFGTTDKSTSGKVIEDVSLTNVNITGKENVGGLIGRSLGSDSSSVDNVRTTGKVSGSDKTVVKKIGGIVGLSETIINNSSSAATVRGGPSGSFVGGLVGENSFDATLKNSQVSGEVTGDLSVGALMGVNKDTGSFSNNDASESPVSQKVGINDKERQIGIPGGGGLNPL